MTIIPEVKSPEANNVLYWRQFDVDHTEQRIRSLRRIAASRPDMRDRCLLQADELRNSVLPRYQSRLATACVTYGQPNYI